MRARARDPHLFWIDGVGQVTCFDPDRSYASDEIGMTVAIDIGNGHKSASRKRR